MGKDNDLYMKAAAIVVKERKCSTSLIQRQLSIGYNKAARLVEQMEQQGIVSAPDHVGKREIATTDQIKDVIEMTDGLTPKTDTPNIIPGNDFNQAIVNKTAQKKSKMKEDADFKEHNDGVYRVAAGELRAFVERFERLDAEKKDIAEQQKEVMAEAKSRGYDNKVLRKIVALRKKDPAEVSEEESVLEMYKEALGM